MIGSTFDISPPPDFFEPIWRMAITSLLGYLPILNGLAIPHNHDDVPRPDVQSDLPIVTYISRQGGGRRLSDVDHEGLVQALKDLEKEGVCEVNVVKMQTLSVKEQVEIAARSTVSLRLLVEG
jgi:protein O-GlcNAc transferase